jgi:SHAQKYF class myb-like DNA-binding protein
VGTAVHPDSDLIKNRQFEIQSHTPHANDTFEKFDGYRTSICDAVTVSSKKVSSSSPQSKRSPTGESPIPVPMSRTAFKYGVPQFETNYAIAEGSKKTKNKSGNKRKKRNYQSVANTHESDGTFKTGRWTRLEHFKFLEALKMFGKEWSKVQEHVFTRTSTQARSHAQKFFAKLDKKQLGLDEFLERLDITQLKLDLRLNETGDSTEYDEDQPMMTIINQKSKSSVLNIAMPGELKNQEMGNKVTIYQNQQVIAEENCDTEQYRSEVTNNYDSERANHIAFNDIKMEDNRENSLEASNVRYTKQRKAKMNHAVLSK